MLAGAPLAALGICHLTELTRWLSFASPGRAQPWGQAHRTVEELDKSLGIETFMLLTPHFQQIAESDRRRKTPTLPNLHQKEKKPGQFPMACLLSVDGKFRRNIPNVVMFCRCSVGAGRDTQGDLQAGTGPRPSNTRSDGCLLINGVCLALGDPCGVVTLCSLPSSQLVLRGVNVGDLHSRGLALPRDSRGGTLQAA